MQPMIFGTYRPTFTQALKPPEASTDPTAATSPAATQPPDPAKHAGRADGEHDPDPRYPHPLRELPTCLQLPGPHTTGANPRSDKGNSDEPPNTSSRIVKAGGPC